MCLLHWKLVHNLFMFSSWNIHIHALVLYMLSMLVPCYTYSFMNSSKQHSLPILHTVAFNFCHIQYSMLWWPMPEISRFDKKFSQYLWLKQFISCISNQSWDKRDIHENARRWQNCLARNPFIGNSLCTLYTPWHILIDDHENPNLNAELYAQSRSLSTPSKTKSIRWWTIRAWESKRKAW